MVDAGNREIVMRKERKREKKTLSLGVKFGVGTVSKRHCSLVFCCTRKLSGIGPERFICNPFSLSVEAENYIHNTPTHNE